MRCCYGITRPLLHNALRMNSHNAHSDESLSCNVSETSTAETDTFDDILSRYTCTCDPELCLKLRRRLVLTYGIQVLAASRMCAVQECLSKCHSWAMMIMRI